MNKKEILYRLQEKDIMQKIHKDLRESFVGCLYHEYNGAFKTDSEVVMIKSNFFTATINMFVSVFMQNFAEVVIDRVVDITKEIKEEQIKGVIKK